MELKHIAIREGRLSSFLRGEMRMSAGLMNRLKWQDKLLVNGIPRHTDYLVCSGDVIIVPLEEALPDYPAEDGALDILYEDEHLLAVDKPAGMLIHPSRSAFTGTLANRVLGYYQATGQGAAFHPITRLDRDTFGVVLLAKNSYVHSLFTELHQQGGIEKIYHARTFGAPHEDQGVINAPIIRKPLPSLLREINPEGKPSLTRFRVLERSETALLELEAVTGRTHQLRLHCAHMGFPILGDPQYNTEASLALSRELGLTGQLLCAKKLEFLHPIVGEQLHLESRMDAAL